MNNKESSRIEIRHIPESECEADSQKRYGKTKPRLLLLDLDTINSTPPKGDPATYQGVS